MRRAMVRQSSVRIALLPVSVVCTLGGSAIVVRDVGAESFGAISVIITLANLLPFVDLGLSAPVINAFASSDSRRFQILQSARRVGWGSAVVLFTVAVLLDLRFGLDSLLGISGAGFAVLPTMAIFCLAVPFGVSSRVLTGRGDLTALTVLQAIIPVATLVMIVTGLLLGTTSLYPVAPAVGLLLSAICVHLRSATTTGLGVRRSLSLRGPAVPVRELMRSGIPMLVLTVASAAALQSHRIVLGRESGPKELASYAIVMVFYMPAWNLLSSVGLQLWSHFQSDAALEGGLSREFWLRWRDFAAVGLVFALILSLLAPVVSSILLGEQAPRGVWLAASALLLVQALQFPAGMLLVDARGLTFQAACISTMAVVSLTLSITLAPTYGAMAPLLATAGSHLLFVTAPCLHRARKHVAGMHGSATSATGSSEGQP